jgi:hypothetical protein
VLRVSTYGVSSSRVGEARPVKPPTSANCDAIPALERRSSGQASRSLRRTMSRMIISPKVCDADGG